MIQIAYLALAFFPAFALLAFSRLPRATATAVTVLVGSLFLPEGIAFDLPAVPPIEKEYITYLSALGAAVVFQGRSVARARPGIGPELLLVVMMFANAGTMLANPRSMWDEGQLEDPLGPYWWLATTADDLLTFSIPFFVGRAMFRNMADLRVLMSMLVAFGFIYTGLILIEVVMSIPFGVFQLSWRLYGLASVPSWRWGGIQPVIFMGHGLAVASYMAGAFIASGSLVKAGIRAPILPSRWMRLVLAAGIVMSRNVAGNIYGWSMTLAMPWIRARWFAAGGLALVMLAVGYPALRIVDVFPNDLIVATANEFDEERARSLAGRFDEEDFVLGNIGHRIWFGWGTFERIPGARTYGVGETGLDGWWNIRTGTNGLVGLQAHYAMLAIPVLFAWFRIRRLKEGAELVLIGGLMAIIGIRCIDLILNGWWNQLPVFLAGALFGICRSIQAPRRRRPA